MCQIYVLPFFFSAFCRRQPMQQEEREKMRKKNYLVCSLSSFPYELERMHDQIEPNYFFHMYRSKWREQDIKQH